MVKSLSFLLIAFAISTPAHADVFGFFASTAEPEQVIEGPVAAPVEGAIVDGSMYGYPFYSGCCEQKSPCSDHLWDGYCHSRRWNKSCHFGNRHAKGGCCDTGCGKGCAGPAQCGSKSHCGSKSYGGHFRHRGHGIKGGCGVGHACGGKGCSPCDPCGKKHHCRLGLFDWMHYGQGHGCNACGGIGCSACGKGGHGKGGYSFHSYKGNSYKGFAPTQSFDSNYYGTPTDARETIQPPQVLVEPTSISDRSAWRRTVPVNPYSRSWSY